eukprot:362672-Chlamydomonas_euryale.AAC.13
MPYLLRILTIHALLTAEGTCTACVAHSPFPRCLPDACAAVGAASRALQIAAAMLLRRYTFRLAGNASDVGMAVGATIHTTNGLHMRITRRQLGAAAAAVGASEVAQV